MKSIGQDKYFDLRKLSEYSSLGVGTLREHLRAANPIPSFKIKGKILVKKSEFDDWLDQFRTNSDRLRDLVDDIIQKV